MKIKFLKPLTNRVLICGFTVQLIELHFFYSFPISRKQSLAKSHLTSSFARALNGSTVVIASRAVYEGFFQIQYFESNDSRNWRASNPDCMLCTWHLYWHLALNSGATCKMYIQLFLYFVLQGWKVGRQVHLRGLYSGE